MVSRQRFHNVVFCTRSGCVYCCREKRLHQQESDLSVRERELDQRQTNFQKWMNEEQALIHQRCVCVCVCVRVHVCVPVHACTLYTFVLIRMSELGLGDPVQSSVQPYHPPSHLPSQSSPYNPHTVTPSHAYTHQFTGSPSQPSHYSPHTVTSSQHGIPFTPPHVPPTHSCSDGGPFETISSTGYLTGTCIHCVYTCTMYIH